MTLSGGVFWGDRRGSASLLAGSASPMLVWVHTSPWVGNPCYVKCTWAGRPCYGMSRRGKWLRGRVGRGGWWELGRNDGTIRCAGVKWWRVRWEGSFVARRARGGGGGRGRRRL